MLETTLRIIGSLALLPLGIYCLLGVFSKRRRMWYVGHEIRAGAITHLGFASTLLGVAVMLATDADESTWSIVFATTFAVIMFGAACDNW